MVSSSNLHTHIEGFKGIKKDIDDDFKKIRHLKQALKNKADKEISNGRSVKALTFLSDNIEDEMHSETPSFKMGQPFEEY